MYNSVPVGSGIFERKQRFVSAFETTNFSVVTPQKLALDIWSIVLTVAPSCPCAYACESCSRRLQDVHIIIRSQTGDGDSFSPSAFFFLCHL